MHIVLLPFPALGHINSLLSIANLLQTHGFRLTLVLTHDIALKFPQPDHHHGSIRYVAIPSLALEDVALDSSTDSFQSLVIIAESMRHGFEELLGDFSLGAPTSSDRLSCIIADCFVPWTQQAAAPFGIPVFSFVTTNIHSLAAYLHVDVLTAHGICPVREDGDREGTEWVDSIPGLPRLRVADLPRSMRRRPHFVKEVVEGMKGAKGGVIVNSAWEVEEEAMEAVIKEGLKVYAIGPLLLQVQVLKEEEEEGKLNYKAGISWEEEKGCLEWLDERMKEGSPVVYVSFGSLAKGGKEQMTELAKGLEASGEAFLWVARPDAMANSPLPEGFLQRTRSRGLVISWSPQLQVLSHPAIAAFLTHCGWNSIVENLCTGCHPMICWPQIAEQRLNARTLVDEWGAGIALPAEKGESDLVIDKGGPVVRWEAVVEALKQVMRGDTGKRLKNKASEVKEAMVRSVGDGGRSHSALRNLLQDIMNKEESDQPTPNLAAF